MSKLRKSAKGMPCQVRIPGVCNFNPETTILAHIGGAGMGMKSNDIHGSFCCSSCHDEIDAKTHKSYFTKDQLKLMHYDGMKRTQEIWIKEEMINV